MPCDILYNGKRYTLAEFVKLLSENELINKINDNTITGSLADGYKKSFAAEFPSPETQIKKEYDTENKPRMGGEVRVGEKPVETEPKPGAGREAAPTGRDVQGDVTAKEEKLGGQVSETKAKIKPLEGAPSTPGASGPDPNLVSVAEKYAKENGIDYKRQGEYVKVDEERAKRIADAYEKMKHDPKDPKVKKAYKDLIEQTKKQYQALVDAGYEFTFFDSKTDPYDGNPSNAMRDLRNNKKMAVYGTYDGYGTEGITGAEIENNPMLEDTGIVWKDQNGVSHAVLANDLFRAVHDAFGHGLEGAGFRARGEENAWQAHVRLFVGDAVAAITTETRGQNSWLNYGPYGEKNRTAKLEDTVFAEQKTGLMPEWTWNEGLAKDFEQEPVTEMPFQDQVKSDMESGEYSLYVDGESAGVKNFDDAMDLIERMDLQDGEVLYIKDATGKSFATIDNKGNINPYESSSLDYDTQKSEIAEKYGEDNQVLKALDNASKALKKNSPDAKIYIHDNSESLANAVSQVTGKDTSAYATDNGHIVMDKDGNVVEVHFAMDGANKVTVYHEIIHPILTSAIGNDVNVMKEMVNAAKSILSEADIKSLEQFIKQYDGDLTKADEFLTELGARITANTVKFKDKAWLDKVKSFINDISKKYAGVTVFEKTDTENIVRDFFRTMSEGLTSSKVDKETLSKKIEEFRLKKTILNPDVAPDVEPGNQIGGSADGLNKSSRDLEKARVKWFNTTPKGDKGDVKMVYPDPVAIEEVFEKSGGAVVFVNSDATKVGTVEINGRKFKLYGGFDYTFIEQNVKDGIGFAASADKKIENLKTIATAIANKRDKLNPQHKGKPVAVFVVSHNGEAMLGEWYASEYIMEGLDVSLSKKKYPGGLRAAKKNFRDAINNVEISTKKEENKKEAALRDKLLGMIDSGEFDTHEGRMRIAKFLAGKDVSFAFRVKLNGSIMPNQGNKKASKNEKNRELRDALSKTGHFLNDFWQKFADERFLPRLNETKLQDKKNKVFGGMSFSGFYYDPKTSLEKQVEHSKGGIEHQQFNSSFKSEGNFLLNSAYNVNQLFPDAGFPFESAYQLYNKEHGTNFVKKTTEVADKMAITEWLLKNGKSKLISPLATMASQSIYSGVADANMKPVLNEYVEAVDTPKPVKKPVISKASKGQRTALPGKNLVPKSYDIDADKEGNYLFYHYGNIEGNKIDPKNWGKNAYTSDKRFHGVSYYYTKGNQKEMVVGGDAHVVAVPKYQVYPFNKDPLNFYDQAEKNFRKEFPNGAFDAVRQIDFMNPLIAKAGFKMVVAEWGEFPLRAETTLPLSYDKKKTEEFRKFGGFEASLRKEKYADEILNELAAKANTSKGVASGLTEAFYDAGGLWADVDKLLANPKIKAQVSKKAISNYEGETKAQKKEEDKGSKLKAAAEQAAKEAEAAAAEPSAPSPETGMKRSKFARTVEEAREGISPLVKEIFEAQGAMYVPKTIKDSAMSANELWNEILDVHDGNLDAAVKNAYVIIMNDDWGGKPEQIGMLGGMVAKKLNEMSQEPGISMEKIAQNESMAVMILTKIRQRMTNAGSETSQVGKFMKDMFMAYPEAVVSYVYTEIDTKNDLAFGSPTREFSGTMEQIVADIMSTEEGRLAMEQLGIGKKNKINKKYTDKKKAISDAFDRVINDIDSLSNGVSFAVPIPPVVIKSGLKAMKKAVLSGLDIAKAVELAVDEVSTQMQGIDFDKNKARAFFKNLADKIMGDVDNNANPEFVTEQMRKKLDKAYQQKVEKAKKALADFEKKKEQRKKLDEQKEADAQAKKEAKEAERAAGRAAREAEKQRAAFEDSLNKLKGDKLRQFAFNIAKNFGNGAENVSQTDVIRAFHQAMGGVQLTAQQQAQLSQAAKTIAAANKLSSQASPSSSQQVINQWIQAQYAASQAAAQISRMLNPNRWIDMFQSTMVMGYITFKTIGANPISNAIHKLYSSVYDDMLFSFVDTLYAPGQKTTFMERLRSLFNLEPTKAWASQLPGSVRRAYDVMKEGSPAKDVDKYGSGYDMKPLTAWHNLIADVKSTPGYLQKINTVGKNVYEGTVGMTTATMSRLLTAGDITFRDPEAAKIYQRWADDLGVDVDEFLKSDEFAEYRYYALEYAKMITFQQENIVSQAVGKRIPKKTGSELLDWFNLLFVKPVIPFFGTPINIKHEMLTMIPPISFAESIYHAKMANNTKLTDAEKFFHSKMAQKMMRRAVGSLPLYAAVSAMLASGLIYIIPRGDEEDEAEKEAMKAFEGMPGRMVIKGYPRSIDGLKFGPFFDYVMFVDGVNKRYEETESVSAAVMKGLITTTRSTIDNTYLQGVKNLVEGLSDPEKNMEKVLINTYGSAYANLLFPTLLSAFTQMSDKEKVLRMGKDESFLGTIYNKVIRERIGFINSDYTDIEKLPSRVNVLGEPIRTDREDRIDIIHYLFDVTRSQPYRPEEKFQIEIYKNYLKTENKEWLYPVAPRDVTFEGESVKLSPALRNEYQRMLGGSISKRLQNKYGIGQKVPAGIKLESFVKIKTDQSESVKKEFMEKYKSQIQDLYKEEMEQKSKAGPREIFR